MQKKSISLFLILTFYLFSLKTSLALKTCEGPIKLDLSPGSGFVGDNIIASASGLKGEDCLHREVHIKEGSCEGFQYCNCRLDRMPGNMYGCLCTFRVPSLSYISEGEIPRQGIFTYYACIDLDNDGTYNEALGEQSNKDLLVYSRYVSLSLVTESIIIIIVLGLLLAIIILVFRMSLRRR